MTVEPSPTDIGTLLREAREAKGLSQTALEEASGVGQRTISGIERGEVKSPGITIVGRLARALGIPADELLEAAS